MNNDTDRNNGLYPNRRFPEFQDDREWQVRTLKDLACRVNTRNKTGEVRRVLTNSAVDGVVDQRQYFDKDIASKFNIENYFVVEKADYVYNPRISANAPVGPISRNNLGTGVMSPLYTVFRFKELENDFYEQYFKSSHWYDFINAAANSGARFDRVSITNDRFMAMPLPCASPMEQQKIADCLSSADELIEVERKKLLILQRHKQGLLRDLFPSETETLPQRRLPEFKDFPGWNCEPLAVYIEEFRKKSTTPDEYEVLTSSRIGLVRQRDYYNTNRITERENVGFNVIPPGFMTYRSRSDDELFFFNVNRLGITGIISVYYPVFTIKNGSNEFFSYLFTRFSEYIGKNSVGNAQKVLSLNALKKIALPVPTLSEQNEIASILISCDKLIAIQNSKLAALRLHKKGLLQDLFPVVQVSK